MHDPFNTEDGRGKASPSSIPSIPDHTLIRCIGRGSYGEVWLARNVFGVFRAVKIVYARNFPNPAPFKREFNGIQKFEPVSRSHDGFIDILQVGQNEEAGYFYYVMELGDDIESGQVINPDTYEPKSLSSEQGKRQRFSVAECVDLGSAIASALLHLHQNNLVHRDVKPSNIIFVHGRPKLADIGLVADQSEAKSHVGTEGFIPPEGQGRPQADIFSLGKVLYEMAMGLDRNHYPELPPDWGRTPDQDQLLELNEVITQACEPEVKLRYGSAEEMLKELTVIGAGGSVQRLRVLERRWNFFKKWGAVAALLAVIGLTGFFWGYRDLKKKEEARLQKVRSLVSYGCRVMEEGDLFGALSWFAEALQLDQKDPVAERMHRTRIAAVSRACPKLIECWLLNQRGRSAQFSPDGNFVAVGTPSGEIEVHQIGKAEPVGKPIRQLGCHAVCFSPNGEVLLAAGDKGVIHFWNWKTGEKAAEDLVAPEEIDTAAFSSDGGRIVVACEDYKAYVWDSATHRQLLELRGHGDILYSAAFSHDGSKVVTASLDCSSIIWDAATGKLLHRLKHDHWVFCAAFSPDDKTVVTTSFDKTAQLWNVATGRPDYKPVEHLVGVRFADFSPDGRYLVTAGYDTLAKIWDLKTGQLANPPLNHGAQVTFASFSPDSRLLLTLSADLTFRIWSLEGNGWLPPALEGSYSRYGGKRLLVRNKSVTIYHEGLRATNKVTLAIDNQIQSTVWSGQGNYLLAITGSSMEEVKSELQTWSTTNGSKLSSFPIQGTPERNWALSEDGHRALSWQDSNLKIWDLRLKQAARSLYLGGDPIQLAGFSPNGRYFFVVKGQNGFIYNSETGKMVAGPFAHEGDISSAEFSPNGEWLATACTSADLDPLYAKVWSVRDGKTVSGPLWHKDGVKFVTFSPDGKLLATCGEDCTARIWDPLTGREICPALQHKAHIVRVQFSEDSRWLVTASLDLTARVWDAYTGEALTPPLLHADAVLDAGFCKADHAIWTSTGGETKFVWDLLPDTRSISAIHDTAEFLSGRSLSGTNSFIAQQKYLLAQLAQLKSSGGYDLRLAMNPTTWHERQAVAAEKHNQPFAAKFHWNQVFRAHVDTTQLRLYRGLAYASLGELQEADTDLKLAVQRAPSNVQAWSFYARVCLASGRTNDFETICRNLVVLSATAREEQLAEIIEVVCLLPLTNVELQPLLQRASGMNKTFRRVKGALEFRAGRYLDAQSDLTPGRYIDTEGRDATCLCFATMNYVQRSMPEKAKQAFQRAHAWITLANQQRTFEARGELLPWKKRFDLQVLHAQAAAVVLPGSEPNDSLLGLTYP